MNANKIPEVKLPLKLVMGIAEFLNSISQGYDINLDLELAADELLPEIDKAIDNWLLDKEETRA